MAVYMFSYDLNDRTSDQHSKDSEAIKDTVSDLGAWCKYLSTTYLIRSNYSLDQIQQRLTAHMKPQDRMILCQIVKPIKGWLSDSEWEWISKNL